MLRAALEALKKKGETEEGSGSHEKSSVDASPKLGQKRDFPIKFDELNFSDGFNSQLSNLIFSSPCNPHSAPTNSHSPLKELKTADFEIGMESDLEALLEELDDEVFSAIDQYTVNMNDISDAMGPSAVEKTPTTALTRFERRESSSSPQTTTIGSAKALGTLPMIDVSTPMSSQISIMSLRGMDSAANLPEPAKVKKVIVAETFTSQQLADNIKSIDEHLILNAVESISRPDMKRVVFPVALMLRDFRLIGTMAMLRFLDGTGSEIIGSTTVSICQDMNMKFHYGQIFILQDVMSSSGIVGLFNALISFISVGLGRPFFSSIEFKVLEHYKRYD